MLTDSSSSCQVFYSLHYYGLCYLASLDHFVVQRFLPSSSRRSCFRPIPILCCCILLLQRLHHSSFEGILQHLLVHCSPLSSDLLEEPTWNYSATQNIFRIPILLWEHDYCIEADTEGCRQSLTVHPRELYHLKSDLGSVQASNCCSGVAYSSFYHW